VNGVDEMGARAVTAATRLAGSVVRVGAGWRGGSGFVVAEGVVLTNAHNVRGERLAVVFADGRRAEGSVKAIDVDGDLAAIAVDTAGAATVEWSDGAATLGTPVLGVTLNGDGGPRVTVGWVSSESRPFRGPRGRRISGGLEHTAPLAPGSSGSPLADGEGRVLGINTNRLGGGFYLALPADAALRARVDALTRGESARRPRLGLAIAPAMAARRMRRAVGLPERDGLLVREVEEGSPAARAGITEGDLIVAAEGRPLSDADDLHEVLGGLAGGTTQLALTVVRGAEERPVSVALAAD
jgi:serine protease Do